MTNIQQRVGQMLEDVDEAKKDIKADLSKVREAINTLLNLILQRQ